MTKAKNHMSNAEKLANHVFDWFIAVATNEMTQSCIDNEIPPSIAKDFMSLKNTRDFYKRIITEAYDSTMTEEQCGAYLAILTEHAWLLDIGPKVVKHIMEAAEKEIGLEFLLFLKERLD